MKNKRFFVKDEFGESYDVTEVVESNPQDEEIPAELPAELSTEEIAALKKLAAVAEKLIALIPAEEPVEEPAEEPIEDEEDPDMVEEKEEEVIDTMKSKDSKKSIGSIEKKHHAEDSVDDSIESAWAKRYGGNK